MWVLDLIGIVFVGVGAAALAALALEWWFSKFRAVRRSVDAYNRARQGWGAR